MQPITEDQEGTLRRWASTVGKRPEKGDKAFLQAEKGLSAEQIDTWWRNAGHGDHPESHLKQALDVAIAHPNGISSLEATHQFASPINQETVQNTNFFGDFLFGVNDDAFTNFDPSLSMEAHNWSPMGITEGEFPTNIAEPVTLLQENRPWLSMGSSQRGLLRSTASSMSDSSPLLSSPLNTWRYMSDSDRSSGMSHGSSLRTWDTASTLVSFSDLYSGGQDFCTENKDSLMIDDKESVKALYSGTRFTSDSIPEEKTSFPKTPSTKPAPHRRKTSKDLRKPKKEVVEVSGNNLPPGKYTCTTCHRGFNRKGDWERHEESQHDPQRYWTCMLGEPAIFENFTWMCAFCDSANATRELMVEHLIQVHKITTCTNKHANSRTFTRKDKLKQHLQQVHTLSESSTRWEGWNQPARKKWAWGCGFCGACSFTWDGRLTHIAEHYERQNLRISQWSHNLVIKGLLKQFFPAFNVSAAWKERVGWAPNSDLSLEWSEKDASRLKHQLEFHDGTPGGIAEGARALAAKFSQRSNDSEWTHSDSRVTTLSSPILFPNTERKTWPEPPPIKNLQVLSFSTLPTLEDAEKRNGLPGYI